MKVRFTLYLAEPLTIDAARGATEQVTEQVTEKVVQFLLCLTSGPPGWQEAIAPVPGPRPRPTFLYDHLQPAIRGGFAGMTRPDAPDPEVPPDGEGPGALDGLRPGGEKMRCESSDKCQVRRRYRQNADDARDAEQEETGTKLIEAVVAGASGC